MSTQHKPEVDRHLSCVVISVLLLAVSSPFIATGFFTHNQHTVATITSRELSIAHLRHECNISFAYEVGGTTYSGSLLGEQQICDSDLPDSLPIRYKPLSPQQYHQLEGDYMPFRTGLVLSALAVVVLTSCCRSCFALDKIQTAKRNQPG